MKEFEIASTSNLNRVELDLTNMTILVKLDDYCKQVKVSKKEFDVLLKVFNRLNTNG